MSCCWVWACLKELPWGGRQLSSSRALPGQVLPPVFLHFLGSSPSPGMDSDWVLLWIGLGVGPGGGGLATCPRPTQPTQQVVECWLPVPEGMSQPASPSPGTWGAEEGRLGGRVF